MSTFLIYGGFIIMGIGVCCLVHKLWNWLCLDPRTILDADFRTIKQEEKNLARGFINPEED